MQKKEIRSLFSESLAMAMWTWLFKERLKKLQKFKLKKLKNLIFMKFGTWPKSTQKQLPRLLALYWPRQTHNRRNLLSPFGDITEKLKKTLFSLYCTTKSIFGDDPIFFLNFGFFKNECLFESSGDVTFQAHAVSLQKEKKEPPQSWFYLIL